MRCHPLSQSRLCTTGSHILGRLQKLSYLQKISSISKSSLTAYNDHVHSDADGAEPFDRFPLQSTLSYGHWSAPSLRPNNSDLRSAMTSFPLQQGFGDCKASPSLPAPRVRTAETMKSSPAFLKTKQLFEDDRRFALRQVHAPSFKISTAVPVQGHKHSRDSCRAAQWTQRRTSHGSSASLAHTPSESSGNSMVDSVSSYHGYAGVNYQSSKWHTRLSMH
ncbi:hypothetical protein ABBQ32_011236 [Trebouxia sp. C0010 RCD-2024]